ncbi:MAG: hypothetical protein R3F39_18440 [Myxococcota bacterium]
MLAAAALTLAMLPRAARADDRPDWVVAAHRSLFIGDGSLVVGDVAAQDPTAAPCLADSADITLGTGTTVYGHLWGDAISIRGTPDIDGVVHYLTSVAPAPSTFAAGALDDTLALPLELMDFAPPEFPTDTPDPAITVVSSAEMDLGDGNYAAVSLDAGTAESPTVLRLTGENYLFGSLTLSAHSRLEFAHAAMVLVGGRLVAANNAAIGASWGEGVLAQDTGVLVLGENGATGALGDDPPVVSFGDDAVLNTQIWAPYGTIRFGDNAFIRGRILAKWTQTGDLGTFTLPGAACGFGRLPPDGECDDGDPCTDDSCDTLSGTCLSDAIASCGGPSFGFPEYAYIPIDDRSSTALTLAWTAAEPQTTVSHYEIRQNGTLIAVVTAPQTSWRVAGLPTGETFTFAITAVDLSGTHSEPLSSAPVALSDEWPPVWPLPFLGVAYPPSDATHPPSVTLDWPPAWDDVGVLRYHVTLDGEPVSGDGIAQTSFTLTGLSAGQSYAVAVTAEDSAGNTGADPITANFTPPDESRPTWDNGQISGVVSSGGLELTWSGATDDVAVLSYYVVVYEDGFFADSAWVQEPVSFPYLFPVASATDYGVMVFPCDGYTSQSCSPDPLSLGLAGLVADSTPPAWPAPSFSVTATTPRSLQLGWSSATDASGVMGYRIYAGGNQLLGDCLGVLNYLCRGASPTMGVYHLEPATTYALRVQAYDWWGNESTDGPTLSVTTDPPTAIWQPTTPEVTATPTSETDLWLDWPLGYSPDRWVSYEVTVTPLDPATPGGFYRQFAEPYTDTTVTNLTPGATYEVTVVLRDEYYYPSDVPLTTTVTMPYWFENPEGAWPPGAWLTAERGDPASDVVVRWSPVTASSRYAFQLTATRDDRQDAEVFSRVYPLDVTTVVVPGLTPQAAFEVHLRLIDAQTGARSQDELTASLDRDDTIAQARSQAFDTISAGIANSWSTLTSPPVSTADANALRARCRAVGLPGALPSFTTDPRGLLTSIASCRMALSTSAYTSAAPETIAQAFIEDHAELFGMVPNDFGTRVTLPLVHVHKERDGTDRVRLTQTIDGLPVFTSRFRIVIDANGKVTRAGGHLTPPWAVASLPESVDEAAAKTVAAEAVAADPADGVTLIEGIYDPAAGGQSDRLAVRAWRGTVLGAVAQPQVYVARSNGEVLFIDSRTAAMTWGELTPAERHVEAYARVVEPCTTSGGGEPTCTAYPGALVPADIDLLPPHVSAEMLQYSSLIQLTVGAADQCEFVSTATSEPPRLSTYCSDVSGVPTECTQGHEECRATTWSPNGERLKDALIGVGAFYYEWTGRVGWDDWIISDDPAEPALHRLRALTDFEIPDADNVQSCAVGLPFAPSPAQWIRGSDDASSLIVIAAGLLTNGAGDPIDDDAFEFTLAHETSHGIDFAEGDIAGVGAAPTAETVREGLADTFGVLRQAYERREDADPSPDWYKAIECHSVEECPCGAPASPPFGVSVANGQEGGVPTPMHLTEICSTCGPSHNAFILTKLAQLMGDSSATPHHGIAVPHVADVGWTYEDLTRLFLDTLKALDSGRLDRLREELLHQADKLTETLPDVDALPILKMVRAAADAVGLWSTSRPVGADVPPSEDLASARSGPMHLTFWAATPSLLCYHAKLCGFAESCVGGVIDHPVSVTTGPTAVTLGDTVYVAFGGQSGALTVMQVDVSATMTAGPTPAGHFTDAAPALATDGNDLYLFYKTLGAPGDIAVLKLASPGTSGATWELVATKTGVDAVTGLSTAFGAADIADAPPSTRVFVAFGAQAASGLTETALWEFVPGNPGSGSISRWMVDGPSGPATLAPAIDRRPFAAYFRGMVHIGVRAAWATSQAEMTYIRCTPTGAGCEDWTAPWILEDSASERPAALAADDLSASVGVSELVLWSLPTTGNGLVRANARSKASD